MDSQKIRSIITEQGLLPLYFHADETVSADVLKALYAGGIRAVEYTNRGEDALHNFKQLRKLADKELQGLQLGVGTIKNKDAAKDFVKAGADFIVSPGLAQEVGRTCEKEELLWIPGCMTPTEIIAAEELGVQLVKLFPGNLLGPSFVGAIKELFPRMQFMPTGGVELQQENIQAWFRAGVSAVGMGSKLITKEILEQKNYEQITALTRQALQWIASIKQ